MLYLAESVPELELLSGDEVTLEQLWDKGVDPLITYEDSEQFERLTNFEFFKQLDQHQQLLTLEFWALSGNLSWHSTDQHYQREIADPAFGFESFIITKIQDHVPEWVMVDLDATIQQQAEILVMSPKGFIFRRPV